MRHILLLLIFSCFFMANSFALTCADFNNTCWVNFENGHAIGLEIVKSDYYGHLKSEYGGGNIYSAFVSCKENADGSVVITAHASASADFIEAQSKGPYLDILNLNFHADPNHNANFPVKRLYRAPIYNC